MKMSEEEVTGKDVIGAAMKLAEPTVTYFLAAGGYFLARKMVLEKGLITEPYVNEIMGIGAILLAVVTAIMIFVWGFVIYLALVSLAQKGDTE